MMAGRPLRAGEVPTPGPWLVRGEVGSDASAADKMLGVEPATDDQPGGWPLIIRQSRPVALGDCPLHLAVGIQRLADAKLMAAAPDLAGALLQLLTSPALTQAGLDYRTQEAVTAAWDLLVRATPHLEI